MSSAEEQPPPPLPQGWTVNTDPDTGNVFYHFAVSGETTWTRPVGAPPQVLQSHFSLPDGWQEYIEASSGVPYYHCTATQETTWERPIPAPPMGEFPQRHGKTLPGLPGAFIAYLKSHPGIKDSIQQFQGQHAHHFSGEADGEFGLSATSSYNEFVAMIDSFLQPFLLEQGVTAETFAETLRQLKSENSAHFNAFDLMLRRMDFPDFAQVMRSQTCLCCGGFFMGVDLEGSR